MTFHRIFTSYIIPVTFMLLVAGCATGPATKQGSAALRNALLDQGFTECRSQISYGPGIKGSVNDSDAIFLLDTGASVNVMPLDTAKRCGLTAAPGTATALSSSLGIVNDKLSLYKAREIATGKHLTQDVHFHVFERQKWESEMFYGTKILGADFMLTQNAVIDCGSKRAYFAKTAPRDIGEILTAEGYEKLPLILMRDGLWFTVILADDTRVPAIFDTGSFNTVGDHRWLDGSRKAPKSIKDLPFSDTGVMFDGFGNPSALKAHTIKNMRIGQLAFTEVPIGLTDAKSWSSGKQQEPSPWLIGYDFLRKRQAVFDYHGRSVYILPE